MVFGIYAGRQGTRYFRLVGVRGYLLTFALALTGISLSGIAIEVPLKLLLERFGLLPRDDPGEVITTIHSYGLHLLLGISLLLSLGWLGWRSASFRIKAKFKKFLSIAIAFATIEAVIEFAWHESVSRLLWLVPQTTPPAAYDWLFPLLIGLMAGLPAYEPLDKYGKRLRVDTKTGERIAERRGLSDE